MTKAGWIILIAGVATAVVGKIIYDKKFAPEVAVDETIEVLRDENKALIKENEELKKKVAELEENIQYHEALEYKRHLDDIEKKDHIEEDDFPMTPDEIMAYNDEHGLYSHIEYGTEEEWDYHGTDGSGDEEVVLDQLEVYLYSDGLAYDEDNNWMDIEKYCGNLLSGMGKDDNIRYIINHKVEEIYKVQYVDQESDLPCPRPSGESESE